MASEDLRAEVCRVLLKYQVEGRGREGRSVKAVVLSEPMTEELERVMVGEFQTRVAAVAVAMYQMRRRPDMAPFGRLSADERAGWMADAALLMSAGTTAEFRHVLALAGSPWPWAGPGAIGQGLFDLFGEDEMSWEELGDQRRREWRSRARRLLLAATDRASAGADSETDDDDALVVDRRDRLAEAVRALADSFERDSDNANDGAIAAADADEGLVMVEWERERYVYRDAARRVRACLARNDDGSGG